MRFSTVTMTVRTMLDVQYSTQFKRDLKTCEKRRYKMDLLKDVIKILRIPEPLPSKYKDHPLSGDYVAYRECHVTGDWLLVYRYNGDVLYLYRSGTHSDLF